MHLIRPMSLLALSFLLGFSVVYIANAGGIEEPIVGTAISVLR